MRSLRSSTSTRSTGRLQLLGHLLGILHVPVGDRDDHGLHRRQPDREGAGEVLDEHAQEALGGAGHGAVQHHRRVLGAVFADVGAAQAGRLDEVHLDGGELPLAAQHIAGHEVGLGAVEGGFAFGFKVIHAVGIQGGAQGVLRPCPISRHPARTCRPRRAARGAPGNR